MREARRRGRVLVWIASAAAVAALAGALCLGTEAGFSRLVLPLAARRAGVEMIAGRGRLGRDGSVGLAGIELRDRRRGLAVAIRRALVRVDLGSLFTRARPSVDLIDVEGASLELREDGEGAADRRPSKAGWREPPVLSALRLPFTLSRARIADSALRVLGAAGEERAAIAVSSFTVEDLLPGKMANLKLSGTLAVSGGGLDAEAGGVELTAVTGQGDDGVLVGWKGAGKARLAANRGEALSVFVSFDSFRRDAGLDASFTLDGRVGARRVGSLRFKWREQPAASGSPPSLGVEVEVAEVRDEVLGPLLAALGRQRPRGAKLDGGARLALSGGELSFDANAEAAIGGGTVRARLLRRTSQGEQPDAELDVTAHRVELADVVPLIDRSDRHRVRGVTDLTAHLTARGADVRALVEAAEGEVEAHVEHGRVSGLGTLDVLAEHTGIDQLRELDDTTLEMKLRLSGGVAGIERMEADSTTVRLFVSGSARTRGDLDLRVVPRLGPDLFRRVKGVPVAGAIAAGADGLLELPVEVHVTGSFSAPRQTLEAHAPAAAQPAGKALADVVETGRRGAAGLVDRLLRRGGERR